jgi:dimethylglycine dehydrogenase
MSCTSGSTWHAAGNLPTFSTSWCILKLQKYSACALPQAGRLGREPHQLPPDRFGAAGAHAGNRMDEFHHVKSMAKANGLDYDILSLSDLKQRYPLHRDPRPAGRPVGPA